MSLSKIDSAYKSYLYRARKYLWNNFVIERFNHGKKPWYDNQINNYFDEHQEDIEKIYHKLSNELSNKGLNTNEIEEIYIFDELETTLHLEEEMKKEPRLRSNFRFNRTEREKTMNSLIDRTYVPTEENIYPDEKRIEKGILKYLTSKEVYQKLKRIYTDNSYIIEYTQACNSISVRYDGILYTIEYIKYNNTIKWLIQKHIWVFLKHCPFPVETVETFEELLDIINEN